MNAHIIDGKAQADSLAAKIVTAVASFKAKSDRLPGLAVVLVGNDPASEIYVRSKLRKTTELGMLSFEHVLSANTTQRDLLRLVQDLNANDAVDGILIQLPLPAHLDESAVLSAIDPNKDVDGLHPENAGRLLAGNCSLVSCTPLGCLMLLQKHLGDLSGFDAIVVGRSVLVGKPMASLLLRANCTVTIAHSRTRDLPAKVRQADIVVAAVGQPEMIKGDWIKPGATVIDVGTTRIERSGKNKLVGDVEFEAAAKTAGAITPVPGGVGPMTIMTLMHNALMAAYQRNRMAAPQLW
jgi:methylenetetrahydrofolate dehydrogenase (NADP+)/methenyltetrahydrofolate cyclohydrolase